MNAEQLKQAAAVMLAAAEGKPTEAVEIVAWRTNRDEDSTFPRLHKSEAEAHSWVEYCNNGPRITKEPLMTVAQHKRLMAAKDGDVVEVPRELRPVLAMILNALDRDAAEGRQARGEMAEELRALLGDKNKLRK